MFEHTVVLFGLVNAPANFQRMMNGVLRGGLDAFCMVYLDDILIFSRTAQEHAEHLRWVLQKLAENKLYLKRSKCNFGLESIEYLGHKVSAAGV